jgi:23S rRNA pseudouridine2605 synthase
MAAERLQKLIARAGLASRRGAESLIAEGRVTVNGAVARLGDSADPGVDRVEVDGRPLRAPSAAVHLAIHKPRGFLSSAHDERGRRSVVSLVDAGGERLWPAGRLDVESEGLMILTNDGEWANRVLHPRYGTEREYAALVDPPPSRAALARLRDGIELDDGPVQVERFRVVDRLGSRVMVGIVIHEGRKHIVRRLLDEVGHPVSRLIRTAIGPIPLADLKPGRIRRLTNAEVAALFHAAGD